MKLKQNNGNFTSQGQFNNFFEALAKNDILLNSIQKINLESVKLIQEKTLIDFFKLAYKNAAEKKVSIFRNFDVNYFIQCFQSKVTNSVLQEIKCIRNMSYLNFEGIH